MGVKPASSSNDAPADASDEQSDRPVQTAAAEDSEVSDPTVGALLDAALEDSPRPSHARQDASPQGRAPEAPRQIAAAERPEARAAEISDHTDRSPDADALRAAINIAPSTDEAKLLPDHPQFQAILRATVLEQITLHADENPGIEVCGVLIGDVYENPQASFVYIDGMIRGEGTSARSTAVTFTAETWQHIHRMMEEKHPGKKIIAWYHTHPGFGIFLSEMDLFIQRHFFNAPWQMAFVFDPQSRESGMFAWRQAQVRRVEYVADDEKTGKTPEAGFPSLPYLSSPADFQEDPTPTKNPAAVDELAGRIGVLETRVRWLAVAFAILAGVAIIWPLLVPLVLPQAGDGKPVTQPATPTATPGGQPPDAPPILPLKPNRP